MGTKRQILATSALIYANGAPHLGHLVGTIQGDIWVRLQKMRGHLCTYICGSDSHGTPIMIKAENMGLTPEALIKQTHAQQQKDFNDFLVEFDNYHPTHSPENETLVGDIFNRLREKGHVSKRIITQLYDPVKNMFLPDRYIKGECPKCAAKDQYGDNCEVCGTTYSPPELKNPYSTLSGAKPIEKESEHYFFSLQHFEDFLKHWTHQGGLQTEVLNKLEEWFKAGLKEWDISRDAPYFGFNIPGEAHKYFYVWLDAPIGYMANFKHLCTQNLNLSFNDYWQSNQTELYHFIGKDIVYFHALFWPALLKGADYRTPNAIFVNGFLTVDGQKMSKSRGTFVTARTYLNHLNPEYLRYYFAAKLSDKVEDLDLNFDDFAARVNADLVGKFVNIASRCAGFLTNHFRGELTSNPHPLYEQFAKAGDAIALNWERLEFSQAIRKIMHLADLANQYIDEQKPWQQIKKNAEDQSVQACCTVGLNLFRILMIYLKPVLPATAKRVETFFNIEPLTWADKDAPLNHHVIRAFEPLIQRIDPKQIEALKMATEAEKHPETSPKETQERPKKEFITIDDFNKVDLRIATILEAEAIAEADKLLRLKVSVGDETRQIIAGIKQAYAAEKLIGRQVVIVANLAPRKMRFGLSEGMVIAAGPGGADLWVVSPDEGAASGMKVK